MGKYEKIGYKCAICKIEVSTNGVFVECPVCNNVFHKDCLSKWLKDNKTCPSCLNKLSNIKQYYSYD